MIGFLFSTPLGRGLIGLAGAAIIVAAIYSKGRMDGAEGVNNAITDENNEAAAEADLAALGFLDCVGAGGVWDFAASKCGRAAAGGGD